MTIKFNSDGLVPVVIQDEQTNKVLMLGYMNGEAIEETKKRGNVVFYSRSKQRLWEKGETSGNTLKFISMNADCDSDALLVKVVPTGPTCHTGTDTCWGEKNSNPLGFIASLASTIQDRKDNPTSESYTSGLFEKGTAKVAQKVGEEAVETVIEAMKGDREQFIYESADLLYHWLILLTDQGVLLEEIVEELEGRKRK